MRSDNFTRRCHFCTRIHIFSKDSLSFPCARLLRPNSLPHTFFFLIAAKLFEHRMSSPFSSNSIQSCELCCETQYAIDVIFVFEGHKFVGRVLVFSVSFANHFGIFRSKQADYFYFTIIFQFFRFVVLIRHWSTHTRTVNTAEINRNSHTHFLIYSFSIFRCVSGFCATLSQSFNDANGCVGSIH